MAKIYYRIIKTGRMTIDEVPTRWRAAVHRLFSMQTSREALSCRE